MSQISTPIEFKNYKTFRYTFAGRPLVIETGKLAGESIEEQAVQVLANLEAVLSAAGMSFANVVKTTVFLTDLGDFAAMNAIYATKFPENPPARSCVQVAKLPAGAKMEMEVVAVR